MSRSHCVWQEENLLTPRMIAPEALGGRDTDELNKSPKYYLLSLGVSFLVLWGTLTNSKIQLNITNLMSRLDITNSLCDRMRICWREWELSLKCLMGETDTYDSEGHLNVTYSLYTNSPYDRMRNSWCRWQLSLRGESLTNSMRHLNVTNSLYTKSLRDKMRICRRWWELLMRHLTWEALTTRWVF